MVVFPVVFGDVTVDGGRQLLLLAREPGVRGGLLCGVQTAKDSRRTTGSRAATSTGTSTSSSDRI